METKKLKMIGYGYEKPHTDTYDSKTLEILHDPETIVSNWWYFDGELEDRLGYDKGTIINLGDFEEKLKSKKVYYNGNKKTFNVVYLPDGVYEVEVLGIPEPCLRYLYTVYEENPMFTGLVVLKSDIEAIQRAEEWMRERRF